jgi:purine-binding chemotaxis protein CheW
MKPMPHHSKGPIDWDEVHARLEWIRAETDALLHPTPEQARAILEERAKILARVPVPPLSAAEILVVATFRLGDEAYAIETRHVRRVVPLEDCTPIPGSPDFLVGVINLHGEVLAVLSLGKLFGVVEQPRTESAKVIVLGGERDEFGILADATEEVTTLRIDELLEPPESLDGIGRQYVRGVTEHALIVLDGAVLLKDERLIIDQGEEIGA